METALTTAPERAAYERLVELLRGGNVTVLSGAGLSTESGIPDYRGADGKRRVTPMTYGEFVASPANRQRYWARSFVGWRRFAGAGPNDGHRAVADLQRLGLVRAIMTQNVDGLHQVAGARDVLELHGNLDRARCLNCGETTRRDELDGRLREANPHFAMLAGAVGGLVAGKAPGGIRPDGDVEIRPDGDVEIRPDGDVEIRPDGDVEIRPDGDVVLSEETVSGFHPPRCLVCQSDLVKPDVVFFGESVPKHVVEQGFSHVEAAAGLVVLGSSLQVMSGYRFVRRADANGIPVAIVTHGPSRGDEQATIRLHAPLGVTLSRIVVDLQA